MDIIKVNAKAIVAFVVGILTNAILAVLQGQAVWPQTPKEWGQYLLTSFVAGLAVWATGNKLTEKQIVKGAKDQNINVITPETIEAVANDVAAQTVPHAEAVVKDVLSKLPDVLPEI